MDNVKLEMNNYINKNYAAHFEYAQLANATRQRLSEGTDPDSAPSARIQEVGPAREHGAVQTVGHNRHSSSEPSPTQRREAEVNATSARRNRGEVSRLPLLLTAVEISTLD